MIWIVLMGVLLLSVQLLKLIAELLDLDDDIADYTTLERYRYQIDLRAQLVSEVIVVGVFDLLAVGVAVVMAVG